MDPEVPLASGTESQLNLRLMFSTNQSIENIQQMRSPQNQRTSLENDRHGEEYQRQSILNRDSRSPENRQNAEYERRNLPHQISAPPEPRFQREHHPYYRHNDAPPSRIQNRWKSRGNIPQPRHFDTNPPSASWQDRREPQEKQNSRSRSTIQSQPPSTAVTDQAPSTSAPRADRNAAEDVEEPISDDDENESQRTSPEQNAASQEVLPSPEQAASSSTQVSAEPPVDNAAKNPPKKSSNNSQNGSKMFPTNQHIENVQRMRSPQNQRTSRENDRYGEEYQRQSILNRDSRSPENRRDAEYERRKLPHQTSAPPEPREYQRPYQNRTNHQQPPFPYPRGYDRFQREHHPFYRHNDAPPSRIQNKWKSRGNIPRPRHSDTNPRSGSWQDRREPREKRNSRPKSTIQSQPPSTAVTDQAPSTNAPSADRNAAENAVEPMSEDDENGSQRTSPEQNAASQEVLPSPEQAPSSSTQVSSEPHVDNAAENPPEILSNNSRAGSQRTSPEQNAASQEVLPSPEQAPSSSTQVSAEPPVDNAAKNPPKKSSNNSQTGSQNQSSVQIASNHQTAPSSISGPASSTSSQPAVQSVTENPANKTEHRSKNSNIKSTNVKKDRVPKIVFHVKKFRCLYDKADPYNRDQTQKEKAWAAISKELNASAKDCQNKWRSQRTIHRRIMKETDGKNFGKHAEFMAAMNFLPPPKNHGSKNNALLENATMDQAQTEQAISQSVPDKDQQFAQALVAELRQFSPEVKALVKGDIYQVIAKYTKFIWNKSV